MSLLSFISKLFRSYHYSNWLPFQCLLCAHRTHSRKNICSDCIANLPILSHRCLRCAQNLPIKQTELVCGSCLSHPPPMHRTYALFPYQAPITRLITGLKFEYQLSYGFLLGDLLAERVRHDWYKETRLPELIIPVPLHPSRLKKRGFNQAIEIALPLSKYIPIDRHGILRIKSTVPQSQLNAKERIKNVAHAFSLQRSYKGKYVAILDDVMTTGATIRELSQTLLNAGASQIDVWCCARRSHWTHI
jgi:ComF family protein